MADSGRGFDAGAARGGVITVANERADNDYRGKMRGRVVLFRGNDGGGCFVLWRMTGRLFGFVADEVWGCLRRRGEGGWKGFFPRIALISRIGQAGGRFLIHHVRLSLTPVPPLH